MQKDGVTMQSYGPDQGDWVPGGSLGLTEPAGKAAPLLQSDAA